MKRSISLASWLLLAASLGCSGLPQYVRGDIRSRGAAPIPAAASIALLPSLAPRFGDAKVSNAISESLRRAGHAIVPAEQAEQADVLIGFLHSWPMGEANQRSESDGFEAVWSAALWRDCPERFSQRLAIAAITGDGGRPAGLLWVGELCSDSGGREASFYAAMFTRELMKSFGMNRAAERFELLSRDAAAPATTVLFSSPAPPPGPESAPLPLAAPVPVPLAAPPPPTTPITPNTEPEAAAEFIEPGPTWSDAAQACAQLALRPGVGCAVLVVAETGRPFLELGYATRATALVSWKQDAADAGAVFCDTAARHGLFEQASVRISAPDQSASRSCAELER